MNSLNIGKYSRFFVNVGRLYQKKRVRVYTELVLSTLTISFFLLAAIRPTATTIAGLIKEIEDQKVANEKLQSKINDLTLARQDYLIVQPKLALLDQALPQQEQVTMLAKELEALSRRTNITISILHFGQVDLFQSKVVDAVEPQMISFSFNASGEYESLKNFLQSLESLRRIIVIKSFGFQTNKKEGQKLSLSLKGATYYFPTVMENADYQQE